MSTLFTRRRLTAALVTFAAAGALWVPSADAAKSATGAQRAAIAKAMRISPVAGVNGVPRSHYKVTGVKISTINPNWAIADLTPTSAAKDDLQSGYGIFALLAGTKSWVMLDFGSAEVGCGYLPSNVINELVGKGASSACQA